MIGVIADSEDYDVVREFFELFKTPWEFYRGNRHYDAVICTSDHQSDVESKLVIVYAGGKTSVEDGQKLTRAGEQSQSCFLTFAGNRIPIYGHTITFATNEEARLRVEGSQECAAYLQQVQDRYRARVGYHLFAEIRTLLTTGQPAIHSGIPSLELHIAFLRDLLVTCGIEVVEIPPVPAGFRFIACLTHDVDHPTIRPHKWDHTVFGFLYRAVIGSLWSLIRGRMSLADARKNWAAAAKVPLVYVGLAQDFWADFGDRYLEVEKGLASTFFVIPFKDYPGKTAAGSAPDFRASRYAAKELASTIRKLTAAGCEIGLHGIDAWLDSSKGRQEIEEIRRLAGISEVGVRMHWLYYDQQSPAILENAGATYDSTIGYNGTVGYRAGTVQVYKPLKATQLLELPMHAMDTALFFPTHLALPHQKAGERLNQLADNAARLGGCLTINWHDRSLAPERLWGGCYRDLIQDLKDRGAWFATASQATNWFRKRRSATFEMSAADPGICAKVAAAKGGNIPSLRLRLHRCAGPHLNSARNSEEYLDMPIDERAQTSVSAEVSR